MFICTAHLSNIFVYEGPSGHVFHGSQPESLQFRLEHLGFAVLAPGEALVGAALAHRTPRIAGVAGDVVDQQASRETSTSREEKQKKLTFCIKSGW